MSSLTYVDKERIAKFFGFSGGYIFTFLDNHNKNNTRDMILEACGIDIYKDEEYNLSQERCIRKIWDEKNDNIAGSLLRVMLDYYHAVTNWDWDWQEERDYNYLRDLEEKLCAAKVIQLPQFDGDSLDLLQKDIERNVSANTPELVLDRLHTFATHFFRTISQKHRLSIINGKGENYSLDTTVANLKNFYKDSNYFSSEFCVVAIQNTINIFAKFNAIRNNLSFSHPNPILEKTEAEYVVKIISATLMFIEKIETQRDNGKDVSSLLDFSDDDLPF